MIQKLAYCLIILVFTSCKQSGESNAQSRSIETPFGIKEITEYNFPSSWKNLKDIDDQNPKFNIKNISKNGYDSIYYFIHKNSVQLYNDLVIDKKLKLPFVPKINDSINIDNPTYKIDSAYFVKSFTKGDITLKLYKDGNKYSKLIGDEKTIVTNYLLLASFDKNENLIDSNIIYYNTHGLYEYGSRYFFFDPSQNIVTKDFYVDENNTYYKGENIFSVNKIGKFISAQNKNKLSEKMQSESLENIKRKYLKDIYTINSEVEIDINNDNKKDKLYALTLINNNIDCNKEDGKQPLLILKNEGKEKYQVYYFNDQVFPSICSYGDAEVYLNFNYENGFIHFKNISKVNNNEIINRDYYFNRQLNLDHIIFSKSIIGGGKETKRTIDNKDFGMVNIKDFIFENFKESRFKE